MYLDFLVKIPFVQGKITRRKKKDVVYIEYEYDRIYDPVRQYTFPKRVTIGKLSETDPELMQPNQNFLKYFPDAELPETKNRTSRSSCLRVGAYFVLRKNIEEYNLAELQGRYFEQRDLGHFALHFVVQHHGTARKAAHLPQHHRQQVSQHQRLARVEERFFLHYSTPLSATAASVKGTAASAPSKW